MTKLSGSGPVGSHTHTVSGKTTSRNGGQTVTVQTDVTVIEDRIKKLEDRVTALEAPVVVPPPVTPPTGGVYGSAIAADGKDNRPIGRSDDSHLAFRWRSAGGTITSLAFNQRFGPDQANVGMGYSHGTGGTIRISLTKAVNGLPDSTIIASIVHRPSNPRTDAENHAAIPFTATIPAGDYCWVFDNIDPDPVSNWMSANCLWIGQPDTNPRQPLDPTDTLAVLDRTASHGWRLYPDNTPCFDVTFADGHHEGQAYTQVITGYEVAFAGSTRVCEHFTYSGPDQTFTGVAFRVQRMSSATGLLSVNIAGASGSAPIDALPLASGLTGGRWVRIPVAFRLVHGQTYDLVFGTTANLKVMPVSPAIPTDNPPWRSRHFTDGIGQKSLDGGTTWAPLYDSPSGPDLQFWLIP